MGRAKDLRGQKFGCLTALAKVESHVTPAGTKVARWSVVCDCGLTKVVAAGPLYGRNHASCAKECNLRDDAVVDVACERCARPYKVKRASLKYNTKHLARICSQCRAVENGRKVVGKPAHNRLPEAGGGFNNLFGSYRQGARNRGIAFMLDADQFRALTKRDCFYCGQPPSQLRWANTKKTNAAPPYVYSGVDRQDPTKPYEIGNVVACCAACNYMKSDLSLDEFYRRVALITDRHRRRLAVEGLTLET
jgi:hypothetical protein